MSTALATGACCVCGTSMPVNPINTCVNCLQTRYDIGSGVAKQVQQHTCRGCNRYERRDGSWAAVDAESKELLALLLKKPRGLASVRLADASFIWTEPHSKRLKLRVTIQKEVVAGAVLQQTFIIEYVIGNKQCPHCQRREAKDTWVAVVQVRQKVPHKRTFLWLEQLILRHGAHADSVNIAELKDGLDFFFDQRSHGEKFVSFVQSVTPTRYKTSKQCISQDVHTGKGKTKYTYSVRHRCRPSRPPTPADAPPHPSHPRGRLTKLAHNSRNRWRSCRCARTMSSGCLVLRQTVSVSSRSSLSAPR